jgi:hypothetical protein
MIRKTAKTSGMSQSARDPKQFDAFKTNGSSVLKRLLITLQLIITLSLAVAAPVAAEAGSGGDRVEWFGGAPSDRWVYGGEFYLWGADIGGDTTSGAPVEVDFDDLFEDLELGLMIKENLK